MKRILIASKRGLRSSKGSLERYTCLICDGVKERSLNSTSPYDLHLKDKGDFQV